MPQMESTFWPERGLTVTTFDRDNDKHRVVGLHYGALTIQFHGWPDTPEQDALIIEQATRLIDALKDLRNAAEQRQAEEVFHAVFHEEVVS